MSKAVGASKALVFIGLAAASLALAAPAAASPAPTVGLSDAVTTAAAGPGALALSGPKNSISIQDAGLGGARIGAVTANGRHSGPATDGTITQSAFYAPGS